VDQHLTRLLDLMEEGAIIVKEGIVEYVNKRVLSMLQLRAEDVIGNPPESIFPSRMWKQLEPSLARARSGRGRPIAADVHWEDATYGEVSLRFRIVHKDEVTVLQVASITPPQINSLERKNAELQERLAAMLGFIASSNIGVVMIERLEDGTIRTRSVNEHFGSIVGREERDIVGRDPCDFVHPDDRERATHAFEQLWDGGVMDQPLFLNLLDGQGDPVQSQISATHLAELAGDVAVCFVQDVSTIELALDEQRKIMLAIEHVEETVVLADGAGRIFYANPAALRNSGYRLEEVIGRPVSIFHAPETVGPVAGQALQEFMRRGSWRGDIMACTKDGVRYPVEVIGSMLRDDGGRPTMIIIVSRRIDERLRYEAELMLTRRHMEFVTDVLERDLVPELDRALADLGGPRVRHGRQADPGEVLVRLERTMGDMRAIIMNATKATKETDEARLLRPMDLPKALRERADELGGYLSKRGVELSLEILDEDVSVMANDMLFETLNGFGRLAERLSPSEPLRVQLVLRKVPGPHDHSASPAFAELSASVLDVAIPEGIRGIQADSATTLRLQSTDTDFSHTVETANLLAYLSGGQLYTEDVDPDAPARGFRFVIILPLVGTRVIPADKVMTLEELRRMRHKAMPDRPTRSG
jgi:PAS domain S-box-containing protein